MKHTIRIAAALLLTASVVVPVQSADNDRPAIIQSGDVIGKYVKSPQGDTLGNVEDIVIDKDGKIVYIAVAVGETAGFGGTLYAVSPDVLKPDAAFQNFILPTSKNELETHKGFDANRWPTQADNRFAKNGKSDGDRKESNDSKERVFRISKLRGMTVKNTAGETLGRINEIVLDMSNHKVAYSALAYGGVLGVGKKLFAIPCDAFEMKSLTLNPADRNLVLDANKQDFENAPGFDSANWPSRGDDRWKKNR